MFIDIPAIILTNDDLVCRRIYASPCLDGSTTLWSSIYIICEHQSEYEANEDIMTPEDIYVTVATMTVRLTTYL